MHVDHLRPGQRFDQQLAMALSAVIGPRWYAFFHAQAQSGGRDYIRDETGNVSARGILLEWARRAILEQAKNRGRSRATCRGQEIDFLGMIAARNPRSIRSACWRST